MDILLKAISDSDTTLMTSGVVNFPQDDGVIQIEAEIITYKTIYMGTLYGCLRGARSTVAASHPSGSAISLVDYFDAGASPDSGITQLTGDVTAGPGDGSQSATLANTTVIPGSYTSTNLTVDSKGRITAATDGAGGTSFPLLAPDGNESTPPYSFNSNPSCGIFLSGNNITFSSQGNIIGNFSNDPVIVGGSKGLSLAANNDLYLTDGQLYLSGTGAASQPDLNIGTTDGFGLYSIVPGIDVTIAIASTALATFDANGIYLIDGNAANPSYSGSSRTAGMYFATDHAVQSLYFGVAGNQVLHLDRHGLAVFTPFSGTVAASFSQNEISGITVVHTDDIQTNQSGNVTITMAGNASFEVDNDSTPGNTRMFVWDVDTNTLQRVTVGAADSGGTGFKVLRIPN